MSIKLVIGTINTPMSIMKRDIFKITSAISQVYLKESIIQ